MILVQIPGEESSTPSFSQIVIKQFIHSKKKINLLFSKSIYIIINDFVAGGGLSDRPQKFHRKIEKRFLRSI